MLRELRLANLAVIEKAQIEFDEGFTVLTGETGAGKSLLVGALSLLQGDRASADLIRTGAEEATVEAAFEGGDDPSVAGPLEAAGIPVEPTLIVRRTISRAGKNKVYLNGALAPLSVLTQVGEALVAVFGQHEHHGLLRPDVQRSLLDRYAGHEKLLAAMGETYGRMAQTREALEELSASEDERAKRIDYLKFLVQEFEDAALRSGEEEELSRERERLSHAEKIVQAASRGAEVLYDGEDAVTARLAGVEKDLSAIESLDAALGGAARLVREALPSLEEAARLLGKLSARLGEDSGDIEARLNETEARIDQIQRLKRKHGAGTAEGLLAHQAQLRAELESLENYDSALAGRRKAFEEAGKAAAKAAAALTQSRREAARRLAKEVGKELSELNLPGSALSVQVEAGQPLSAGGADRVEFLLAPNPGEAPRPLSKIASGGELSRILLALRLVLTEPGRVRTLVLDEVDAGIGGVTAETVGKKIARLSGDFQVIAITHLPQIACRAGRHLRVSKEAGGGRTATRIEELSGAGRIEEVSRMLGGSSVSDKVRATARELLAQAAGAR